MGEAAGLRIEQHQTAPVVRDENPSIAMDLEPVRPAVILGDLLPFARPEKSGRRGRTGCR